MYQPVPPQQEDGKDRKSGKDHPEQQDASFRRVPAGECGLGTNGTHAALAPLRAAAPKPARQWPLAFVRSEAAGAVQRHMPEGSWENFPICASPPACNWNEIALLLASSASRGVIACASCFNSSPACSSSSPCVWEQRPSGQPSTPIAASIGPRPHPQNGSPRRWKRSTGASCCCAATERANISCRCPIGAPSKR